MMNDEDQPLVSMLYKHLHIVILDDLHEILPPLDQKDGVTDLDTLLKKTRHLARIECHLSVLWLLDVIK